MIRLAGVLLVAFGAAVLTGCSAREAEQSRAALAASRPTCRAAWRPGWQALANRVEVPVFCPSWLPDPLKPEAHLHSPIGRDRSWQIGFHDFELRSVELHVVVSGYPEGTPPRCEDLRSGAHVSCWRQPSGTKRIGDRVVTVYERGLGHELRHVVYTWRENGTLYAVSMHVDYRPDSAIPRSRAKEELARVVRGLVQIEPGHAANQRAAKHES